MTLLPPLPVHLHDGHAIDTNALQPLFDGSQLERLNNGSIFFIVRRPFYRMVRLLENVALFAVLAQIESLYFALG